MFTKQRLTGAYEGARVEPFDETTKYVFISDHHRGDGSLSDEFTRNRNIFQYALEYYYRNSFTYVEAGDGDELWEYQDVKHIKNAHPAVFSTIKQFFDEDRFIMMWGNHNIYLKDPSYVERHYYTNYDEYYETFYSFLEGLKPIEALVLKHTRTGQEILTVHGHQGDAPNDQFWVLTMLSLKYFWRFLHAFGIRNPSSPVKNISRRHKIEKNYSKWISENKMMLICGHTHRFKYPRKNALPYFNTGCCVYPTTITAIELVGEEIQLVRWHVKSDEEGSLNVVRSVMRGPDNVKEFDLRDLTESPVL
ncbi:serine/threonine protein phosphatase [Jeotgalibaca dankookensis]|uniref:serine/threonine protein phosphatase n=1 Tax=Jeotgalibaca dankookensis TaxID=708126 RepID=UPI000785C57F|nr:serine/threonine protein phosphatase [Jeotgalibaca dankookensis]